MGNLQNIKEKILYYVEKKNIVKVHFYKEIGLSGSNFRGTALKKDLGVEKFVKIVTLYPDLQNHLRWILLNEGTLEESIKKSETLIEDPQISTEDKFIEKLKNSLGDIIKDRDENIIAGIYSLQKLIEILLLKNGVNINEILHENKNDLIS